MENPIQYHAPLYKALSNSPHIDLEVFYLTDRGIRPYRFHGITVQHDRSTLEGYRWQVLPNYSPFRNSRGVLDNFDPDVYRAISSGRFSAVWFHGHNYLSHWIGFVACVRSGTPILVRGESEDVLPRTLHRRMIKRPLLQWLYGHTAAFLYIGRHNRRFYEAYGAQPNQLFYVPYCVDNEWIRGTDEERHRWRREVRSSIGIPVDSVVFICTTKQRPPKRPLDAVKAFCAAHRFGAAHLIMLGDGPLRFEAEAYAQAHSAPVHFTGQVDYPRVREFLAASDALVFPSVENFGSLNEPLAAALAMLVSDRVVAATDFVNGRNGFIFENGNVGALAQHMRRFVDDREALRQMREESLRHSEVMSLKAAVSGVVDAVQYVTRH